MIFAARGQKPIIAYASGSCCSGAYWIASSCDKIFASDTAILGSIGVVSIYRKDDEKKCVEIVSSQSPNKRLDINSDEGRSKIQTHIDDLAEVFINKVALSRNISAMEVVDNFGGGDVFVGQKAVSIGLADGISSFEDIIAGFNFSENTFMNEKEIILKERERVATVLAKSTGKEATAQALLATELNADEILAVLDTMPSANDNSFEKAMANIKNPAITPATEATEETPDVVASRIASYTMETN